MAKFVKFTNAIKLFANGDEQQISEYIINVDEIRTISTIGEDKSSFILVPKISNSLNPYTRLMAGIIISKKDYEQAKKILSEV